MAKIPFEQWKQELDAFVAEQMFGMTTGDIVDMNYWDMWNNGLSIEEAWSEVKENNDDLQGFEDIFPVQ